MSMDTLKRLWTKGWTRSRYTPRGVTKPPLDIPKFAMGRSGGEWAAFETNIGGTSCGGTRRRTRPRGGPEGNALQTGGDGGLLGGVPVRSRSRGGGWLRADATCWLAAVDRPHRRRRR